MPITKAADASTTPIQLTVVLRRNDESGLERLADRLNDPKSPEFRRWLTPEQVADRFGPSSQDFETVEDWFRSEGFAIVERSSNRMTLTVSAPRSTIERSLQVTIADYKVFEPGGDRAFHANRDDPSLPIDVATRIHSIAGLSTLGRPRPVIIEAINRLFCGGEDDAAGYNKETESENLLSAGEASRKSVAKPHDFRRNNHETARVSSINTS